MRPGLALAGLASLAALLFAALAWAMLAGAVTPFDATVRGFLHGLAGPALTEFAETVTWLGTLGVLAVLAVVAVLWFRRRGQRARARLLGLNMLVALALENGLKFSFQRPRPPPFFGTDPTTYSFPSGHALFSLCFYGMLAVLLSRDLGRSGRAVLWLGTAALVAAIGASRIYLGVHYPSDVLGGYLVAIAITAGVLAGERRWPAGSRVRRDP